MLVEVYTKSERNYPPHKLELLALKWEVTDKFKEVMYMELGLLKSSLTTIPYTYVLTTAKLDTTTQR